jgi:outer membrane protein assembly factor BamB
MIRFALLVLLMTSVMPSALADDWPHWRGEQRNGIVRESSGWDGKHWLADKPLWSAKGGSGSSSVIVVGEKLYTFGWEGGKDVVRCLNAATGERLWEQSYSSPKYGRHHEGDEGFYEGPSSTPAFDGESQLLFTLSLDGALMAWDASRQGEQVWRRDLIDEYKIEKRPRIGRAGRRDYGYTTSPLVLGDLLLVEVGSKEKGTIVAYDKRTGQPRWHSEARHLAGHSGGLVPLEVEGAACVAVLAFDHFLVLRTDLGNEGKTVGEIEWITAFANNIPTPAVEGDRIVVTSGAGDHYHMCGLKVSLKGLEKLWEKGNLGSPVCSPVVKEGRFYWLYEGLMCSDLATGDTVWQGPLRGHDASLILTADDRLIACFGKGRIVLAETAKRSPDKYTELARTGPLFNRESWPHVVLSHGRLYAKDRDGQVKCFELLNR